VSGSSDCRPPARQHERCATIAAVTRWPAVAYHRKRRLSGEAVGLVAILVAVVVGGCGLGAARAWLRRHRPPHRSRPYAVSRRDELPRLRQPQVLPEPEPANLRAQPRCPAGRRRASPSGGWRHRARQCGGLCPVLDAVGSHPNSLRYFGAQVARVDPASLAVTVKASFPGATAVSLAGGWLWWPSTRARSAAAA